MKKRKELNALIGLGGESKRKKTKKGSGHRLLRTEPPDSDSESSSEDDEFGHLSAASALGKRTYAQCCNICYPLCAFIILAACVVACAGLIWMQIALKEDLDALKEKLRTMESSQKVSAHEIPKLSEDLLDKQKKLENIENGDKGLSKVWSNITEINKKISLLDSAVSHLKANIKSASDLINLPTTVEELQKSVATIGSTLTSVQHDVETMQTALDEQKKTVIAVRKNMDEKQDRESKETNKSSSPTSTEQPPADNRTSCLILKQEMLYLQDAISELNATQVLYQSHNDEQVHSMNATIGGLKQRMFSLENDFLSFNVTRAPRHNMSTMDSRTEELREKLQLINALTSKPQSEVHPGETDQEPELKPASGEPGPAGINPEHVLASSEITPDQGLPPDSAKAPDGDHFKDHRETDNQHLNGSETPPDTDRISDSNVEKTVKGFPAAQEIFPPEVVKKTETGKSPLPSIKDGSSQTSNSTRLPRFLSHVLSNKETGRPLSLPGIGSLKDLQEFFLGLGEGSSEGLSYDELKKHFGFSTPDIRELESYDVDKNQKYSQAELQAATGL